MYLLPAGRCLLDKTKTLWGSLVFQNPPVWKFYSFKFNPEFCCWKYLLIYPEKNFEKMYPWDCKSLVSVEMKCYETWMYKILFRETACGCSPSASLSSCTPSVPSSALGRHRTSLPWDSQESFLGWSVGLSHQFLKLPVLAVSTRFIAAGSRSLLPLGKGRGVLNLI